MSMGHWVCCLGIPLNVVSCSAFREPHLFSEGFITRVSDCQENAETVISGPPPVFFLTTFRRQYTDHKLGAVPPPSRLPPFGEPEVGVGGTLLFSGPAILAADIVKVLSKSQKNKCSSSRGADFM